MRILLFDIVYAYIVRDINGTHMAHVSSSCDMIASDLCRTNEKSGVLKAMPKGAGEQTNELSLDEFLCFAIYSVNHAFTRVYKPLLDKLKLTYPQYLVMVLLWEKDDRTVGDLGEKLFLESNTLTPLLKRLEASGHIKRNRNPADERQVRVRLTLSGRSLRKKAQTIPPCIVTATGLSGEELVRLRSQIFDLQRTLDRIPTHA